MDEDRVPNTPMAPARIFTDRDGRVEDANLEACVMLDMGRRALIGKRLATFVARADLPNLDRLLAHLPASRRSETCLQLRDRVGRLKAVQIEGAMPTAGTRVAWKVRPVVLAA
jgi:PAS domain-containing protein